MMSKEIKRNAYLILATWQTMDSPSGELSSEQNEYLFSTLKESPTADQLFVVDKARTLCGDGDLQEVLKCKSDELRSMLPPKEKKAQKKRRARDVYEVTQDRTKSRLLVRARFDGEPFFTAGDQVHITVDVIDDVPCVILRKMEEGEDHDGE
jgi:hypothetical protein